MLTFKERLKVSITIVQKIVLTVFSMYVLYITCILSPNSSGVASSVVSSTAFDVQSICLKTVKLSV